MFQIFLQFNAMVERVTGKHLKYLQTDNGREYTSYGFKSYYLRHGIRHENTVLCTIQCNGVIERGCTALLEGSTLKILRQSTRPWPVT